MAPKSASGTTKRKRASTTARHTPNKRARKTKKAPPGFEPRSDIKVEEYLPDSDEDPEKSWDIKDILEEGYDLNLVHHYFVKWEDEEYPDSWVQAINANKLAVKYWKEKKKAERNKRESTDANSSVASTALSSFTSTATPTPSRSRRSGLRNTVSVAADATEGHPPDRVSPLVQVRRQSDFDRSEFERFSQLPSSQPNSSPVPDKADTGRARDFRASGIVPDSQSTDGSGTYIQPTQATQTTQETSGSSGAGAEAELDDSLLSSTRRPHRRSSVSIPETEAIEDSQLETQPEPPTREDQLAGPGASLKLVPNSSVLQQPESELPTSEAQGPDRHTSKIVESSSQFVQQPELSTPEVHVPRPRTPETVQQPELSTPEAQLSGLGTLETAGNSSPIVQQSEPPPPEDQILGPQTLDTVASPSQIVQPPEIPTPEAQAPDPDTSGIVASSSQQLELQTRQDQLSGPGALETAASSPVPEDTDRVNQDDPGHESTQQLNLQNTKDLEAAETTQQVALHNAEGLETETTETAQQVALQNTEDIEIASAVVEDSAVSDSLKPVEPSSPHAASIDQATVEQQSPLSTSTSTTTSSEPTQQQEAQVVDNTVASTLESAPLQDLVLEDISNDSVTRHDFAATPQDQSNSSSGSDPFLQQEQHAQIISTGVISTGSFSHPEDEEESVRLTTEFFEPEQHSSPASRHDSSQESPERQKSPERPKSPERSLLSDESSIPRPPLHSLEIIHSTPPPRPRTPSVNMSSADDEPGSLIKNVQALFQKRLEENPFVPSRRVMPKSNRSPSSSSARSPSTIPDRTPLKQGPTSLRTVALPVDNNPAPASAAASAPASALASAPILEPTPALAPATEPAPEPAPEHNGLGASSVPASVDEDEDEDEDMSDAESLLNDDLDLASNEYIIPLPLEGRQKTWYSDAIQDKLVLLEDFLNNPHRELTGKVETLLQELRALETHIDLWYTESGSSQAMRPGTQLTWDLENMKFRFLATLLESLRDVDIHVILAIQSDHNSERLSNIIELFCREKHFNYNIPERPQAHSTEPVGLVRVTVLSMDSSPIVRPANAIICLNGVLGAGAIRDKNWSMNPDVGIVPIFHLVIPRTVGHIDRYVSTTLSKSQRLHTIVASLAQLRQKTGSSIIDDSPRAVPVAKQASLYLRSLLSDPQHQPEWQIPAIGSIKDVIEFQSQRTVSPTPKRPRVEEILEDPKRMRFTPQLGSSAANDNDITHISDSMPGTAEEVLKLKQQLRIAEAAHKASEKRFSEHEVVWNQRQTTYEDLTKIHRISLGEIDKTKTRLETAIRAQQTIKERLDRKTSDYQDIQGQLTALQTLSMSSSDDKVAEIARLRKDLADANTALKKAQNDDLLEYTKEQYRKAQETATSLKEQNDTLTRELEIANRKAAGEASALKQLHLDSSFQSLKDQLDQLKLEKKLQERQIQQKDDEIVRLKSSRSVGTRAQTPKAGNSRAASPMSRDRLNNLRAGKGGLGAQ